MAIKPAQLEVKNSVSKKTIYLVKPGTWLEVILTNGKSVMVLLLERPQRAVGELLLNVFVPGQGRSLGGVSMITSTQVTAVWNTLNPPEVVNPFPGKATEGVTAYSKEPNKKTIKAMEEARMMTKLMGKMHVQKEIVKPAKKSSKTALQPRGKI